MTNIVLVVLDTARADTVAEFVDQNPESTLADIHERGTTFTNTFATAPWTLPSHASLFTGTYPSKHGAHAAQKRLGTELTTLAEAFQSAGYETLGLSNNTWVSDEFGFAQGFDWFFNTWQLFQTTVDLGAVSRTTERETRFRTVLRDILRGNPLKNVLNAVYGEFLRKRHDDGAARTNKVLRQRFESRTTSDPFLLFVNYLEPHLEYRPPKEIAERALPDSVSYREAMEVPQDAWGYITGNVSMTDHDFDVLRRLYRSEVAYVDERLGEVRDVLQDNDMLDDTVFVILGDHGENIGDHGLMDHQYCLYDTLIHVPLYISGGEFNTGEIRDELVQLVDIAPTVLDAAGITDTDLRSQSQGVSLHPNQRRPKRETAIAEYRGPQPTMAALEQRVDTVPESVYGYDRGLRAVRTTEYKYVRGTDGFEALYDLQSDQQETTNVADEHTEAVAELRARLDNWLSSFEHASVSATGSPSQSTQRRLEDLGYL